MGRGNQVVRQWRLLRILEGARRPLALAEVHRQLDEDNVERTIRRDLYALRDAGFPLEERDGRWRLIRPVTNGEGLPIEPSQMLALLLSEDMLGQSPISQPLRELRARLESTLTASGREFLARLRHHVGASPLEAVADPESVARLKTISAAIDRRHRLRMSYWSPSSGNSERKVEPLFVWYAAGGLYLVAWDEKSEEVRKFAVQRMSSVRQLDERYQPDTSFKPQDFMRAGFRVVHGRVHRIEVDFTRDVAHLFAERRYHPTQSVTPLPDGVRVTFKMSGLPEFARWLAGFGASARPRAPRELITLLRDLHTEALTVLPPPEKS